MPARVNRCKSSRSTSGHVSGPVRISAPPFVRSASRVQPSIWAGSGTYWITCVQMIASQSRRSGRLIPTSASATLPGRLMRSQAV
jgi:hypothetical protein